MPQMTALFLASLVALLSLLVVLLVVSTSRRSLKQSQDSLARATADRERRISTLEEEKQFLRSLDSVRFTERYFATRAAIDERAQRLEAEEDARQRRLEEVARQVRSLEARTADPNVEMHEVQARLARTLEEARRLEAVVAQVNEIGPIRIDEVRVELNERRQAAQRLKSRLESLSMSAEARTSELERLKREHRKLRDEAAELRREVEVTRSLGPAVDALLGVNADMKRQISHIEGRLEGSLGALIHTRMASDPLADFLRAIRGGALGEPQRRNLLPVAGAAGERDGDAPTNSPGAVPSGDDLRQGEAGTANATEEARQAQASRPLTGEEAERVMVPQDHRA